MPGVVSRVTLSKYYVYCSAFLVWPVIILIKHNV